MKSTYNVNAQYKARLLLIAPLSHIFLMFHISNMVINMIAAKIANETIHIIILEPINQFTKARIPAPINKPNPSMSNGDKLPLVSEAIIVINKKIPEVMPKAIPKILQSMNNVNEESNVPINTV